MSPRLWRAFPWPSSLVVDVHLRDERAKVLDREPFGVRSRVVNESGLDALSATRVHFGHVAPLHVRVDDEVALVLVGGERVGLGHHALVELLALADADFDLLEARRHRRGEVGHPERGDLGDERLATRRLGQRLDDELDALLERNPEARHAHVGDGELRRALADELVEERDDRAAGARDVAIANDRERGARLAAVGVSRYEQLVGDELRAAVEVHRIHRFVGGERDDLGDARVERGVDDGHGSIYVGLDCLHGVVLARGHLLKRRCMHYVVNPTGKGTAKTSLVADVTDEEAQLRVVVLSSGFTECAELVPHDKLLILVARIDDQLLGFAILEQVFSKRIAE